MTAITKYDCFKFIWNSFHVIAGIFGIFMNIENLDYSFLFASITSVFFPLFTRENGSSDALSNYAFVHSCINIWFFVDRCIQHNFNPIGIALIVAAFIEFIIGVSISIIL